MIYLYLDASVRGLFKQKYSPTELMHSPITKSDHSAPPGSVISTGHCTMQYTYMYLITYTKSAITNEIHDHNIIFDINITI